MSYFAALRESFVLYVDDAFNRRQMQTVQPRLSNINAFQYAKRELMQ
jgi:hypothetical protein